MSTVASGNKYKHRSTGAIVRVTKVEDVEGHPVVFYRFQKKSESKLEQQMILNESKYQTDLSMYWFHCMFEPA